ncbi:MAG: hypothetical protein J5I65_14335 [Aridibacter famidurans]|nr:hypothetical protein [Aridibacter famidurans]
MQFPKSLFIFAAMAVVFSSGCGIRSSEPADLKIVRTKFDFGFRSGEPFGIEAQAGSLYISDGAKGRLIVIPADGSSCRKPSDCSDDAVLTDKLHTPSHIAVEEDGSVLVADSGDHTIRRVSPEGKVSPVAGTPGEAGFLDGKASEAKFRAPIGIATDGGRIFVADSYNDRIRVIENGEVSTLAGSGRGYSDGSGGEARFDTPSGLATLADGRLLVADLGNRRLRTVDQNGKTITLAGTGEGFMRDGDLRNAAFSAPTDVAVGKSGEIYVADGDAVRVIGGRITPIVETITSRRRGFEDREDGLSRFNRVSGIAVGESGDLFASDSDNGLIRVFGGRLGEVESKDEFEESRRWTANDFSPSGVWPYDPPDAVREIAGTFGEIRGERDTPDSLVYFHNGLDITGGYGETARFVMDEKVLDPEAVKNVDTLRELIRLPLHAYIHVNIGRTTDGERYNDPRFIIDGEGENTSVRVPRGVVFESGEPVGTLNRMNHVHLVVGAPGREFNGLWGLVLPGVSDSIPPVLEKVELFTENWEPFETVAETDRIKVGGRIRIVAEGYDRMDGNAERRRLGLYMLGYRVFNSRGIRVAGDTRPFWTITFDELPDDRLARYIFSVGSRSGATGPTVFRYIVSNRLSRGRVTEGFINFSKLDPGDYDIQVVVADIFGNTATKRIPVRSR